MGRAPAPSSQLLQEANRSIDQLFADAGQDLGIDNLVATFGEGPLGGDVADGIVRELDDQRRRKWRCLLNCEAQIDEDLARQCDDGGVGVQAKGLYFEWNRFALFELAVNDLVGLYLL